MNNIVQFVGIVNVVGGQSFEVRNYFIDEGFLLITLREDYEFQRLNDFFDNRNFNGEESMV